MAHAQDAVARRYVGVAVAGYAGGSFNGGIGGYRVEALTGYRLSRWISVEGFFDATFQSQPLNEPTEGAACSGSATDLYHWQTFGVRTWTHVAHGEHVDFSIALPWLAVGAAYDQQRSVASQSTFCYRSPLDTSGVMLELGLVAFSLEMRAERHVGIRVTGGAELDLGAVRGGLGFLAVTASIGPVVRF